MKRPTTVVELLMNTKEVLEKFGWTKGVWQSSASGENGLRPVCLAGAMYIATVNDGIEIVEQARYKLGSYGDTSLSGEERKKLKELLGEATLILTEMMRNEYGESLRSYDPDAIPTWNDRGTRRRYDVMNKLNKAIEKAQKLEMESKGVEVVTA